MKTNSKTLLGGFILALGSMVLFFLNWWNFIPFSEWILYITPSLMMVGGVLTGHGLNYKKMPENIYYLKDLPEGANFRIVKVFDESEGGARVFHAHMNGFGYFLVGIKNTYFEKGKVSSSFDGESYVKHGDNLYSKK